MLSCKYAGLVSVIKYWCISYTKVSNKEKIWYYECNMKKHNLNKLNCILAKVQGIYSREFGKYYKRIFHYPSVCHWVNNEKVTYINIHYIKRTSRRITKFQIVYYKFLVNNSIYGPRRCVAKIRFGKNISLIFRQYWRYDSISINLECTIN